MNTGYREWIKEDRIWRKDKEDRIWRKASMSAGEN